MIQSGLATIAAGQLGQRAGEERVFTFSADTLIGPMIGPVKAYGAIGAGDLLLNVQSLSSVAIPNPTARPRTTSCSTWAAA